MIVYVFSIRNFNIIIWNIFHIINEGIIATYHAILLAQLMPQNRNNWKTTSNACMKLITTAWALNLGCSILLTSIKIVTKTKEFIKKSREKKQLTSKVSPANVAFTTEAEKNIRKDA